MEKLQMIYEGKAKQLYTCEREDALIIHYKDDATAFNGVKKAQIEHKGELNNAISTIIFNALHKHDIPTHYIETLNNRDQLCHKVKIIPLEVIIRNLIAGSMAKRLDIKEGTPAPRPIYELCYKNDDLGDPLINEDHAFALGAASEEDLATIKKLTLEINRVLIDLFDKIGIILVDFKIEFGRTLDGRIVLADEISPDTCRFWDKETRKKLDKDRFRRDLGNVEDAYQEILKRLSTLK
ncbi:MAG: phosphoribosylaminoimidazolesuccinocarboxamide synthase [Firmicutes bacterium GWF2_51_9]|nr:MAG: phosphoribosylaminoimidazolesuccinocarboxamide synthase [Firmicutes bacterium GWF2_51_9]OGS57496.1 MAG: phosphoribosylaminoimidazolesuccinocarboxamide synthase [Firmicutes bacterium GWE2_51_13]HAM63831.1 phosphoribosylaminoimidazolesuccinocarboxamide synthase [Erysipelotrichaceae bacterium]HBZ41506.1 phosphoribosylaminoimidazolesuccinocarboxamide synthase [Erysipelotrichaceae bacterium]